MKLYWDRSLDNTLYLLSYSTFRDSEYTQYPFVQFLCNMHLSLNVHCCAKPPFCENADEMMTKLTVAMQIKVNVKKNIYIFFFLILFLLGLASAVVCNTGKVEQCKVHNVNMH